MRHPNLPTPGLSSMRCPLALVLLLLVPLVSRAQPSADVPVKRVILFTSGVGYFEHEGSVLGDADVTLRFEESALDDVIKSLVVEDQRGRVGEVVYPSQAPLARRLQAFAVDLSRVGGFESLLTQIRGAELIIETSTGTYRGALASVDGPTGGDNDPGTRLTLFTTSGLRTFSLQDARRVEIADEALRAEVSGALAALAEGMSGDRKPVTVRFRGSRQRPVRLGYVVESPVWKTTYRLMLPAADEPEGYLQGWAVVENPTESDWDGVRLELISGRPISFEMDLYTPRYLQRPIVQIPDAAAGVVPQTYADGARNQSELSSEDYKPASDISAGAVMRSRSAPPPPVAAPAAPEPMAIGAGVTSLAETGAVGELFAYVLNDISISRRGSAMLPIVTDPVRTERLSVFTPGSAGRHPLRGARLRNTTTKHLRGGPITVFDDGYAGDALLADLGPGDDRLITFAVDQDLLVDPVEEETQNGEVQLATITNGVLTLRSERVRQRGYRVENRGDRDRTLLIEHPRMSGGTLSGGLEPDETAPGLYRLRLDIASGETDTLVVREAAPLASTYRLSSLPPEQITQIIRTTAALSPEIRRMLDRAADLARQAATAQSRVNVLEQERNEISTEQNRIRQNLQAVDSDTDYGKRLLAKLNQQEDRLEALDSEIERARSAAAASRNEFQEAVNRMSAE